MQSVTSLEMMRAGILLGLLLGLQELPAKSPLAYFYVDSNVGDSSGGHSAVRAGDFVYHYQYFPDRIFRIVRDDTDTFIRTYNQSENRSIRVTELDVTSRDEETVEDHLTRLLLIQEKHALIQAEFASDIELASAIEGSGSLEVEGLGFFGPCNGSEPTGEKIQPRGAPPLNLSGIEGEQIESVHTIPLPPVKIDDFPIIAPSYASRYKARLRLTRARQLLSGKVCLDQNAFYETDLPITADEVRVLKRYSAFLNNRIPRLLAGESNSQALMLAIAREAAIAKSLEGKKWVLLDVFQENDPGIPRDPSDPLLAILEREAHHVTIKARELFVAESGDPETAYNLVENAIGRWREIKGQGRNPATIRFATTRLIPRGMGRTRVRAVKLPAEFREITERNRLEHLHGMHKTFGYNLINRNCTTEILRELQKAFPAEAESRRALGGTVNPDGLLTFIPFISSHLVESNLRIAKVETILSRRRMALEAAYAKELDPVVYARESNVLTSRLYKHRPIDTYFLMFTDDVIFPRPLYGLVNLGYAIGQTVLGIGYLPWGTERINSSTRGILFSMPELVFFNIRKGSFDDLSGPEPPE
ncbi:MAG: hypothetical protein JNM27_14150 [Leptospirales bacterium]|nr:hypothetical protein [Leptospirales bacterium]